MIIVIVTIIIVVVVAVVVVVIGVIQGYCRGCGFGFKRIRG